MALCRLGPLVQTISGSIGAVTFKAGKSTGVMTLRQRRHVGESFAQNRSDNRFALWTQRWFTMEADFRDSWETWAKGQSLPDRIGGRRGMTGEQAFVWFHSTIEPTGYPSGYIYPNFPLGKFQQLEIASLDFTAGGACNVTLTTAGPYYAHEYMYLDRRWQYGARPSAGRHVYITALHRSNTTLDWGPSIASAGVVLEAGEQVRVTLQWWNLGGTPSTRARGVVTVG